MSVRELRADKPVFVGSMVFRIPNGNGGTCYGDSGGPYFIHLDGQDTDIVASITVTGDAPCKVTDKT